MNNSILFGSNAETQEGANVGNAVAPFFNAHVVDSAEPTILTVRSVYYLEDSERHIVTLNAVQREDYMEMRNAIPEFLTDLRAEYGSDKCLSEVFKGALNGKTNAEAEEALRVGTFYRRKIPSFNAIMLAYDKVPVPNYALNDLFLTGFIREGNYVPQIGERVRVAFRKDDLNQLSVQSILPDTTVAKVASRMNMSDFIAGKNSAEPKAGAEPELRNIAELTEAVETAEENLALHVATNGTSTAAKAKTTRLEKAVEVAKAKLAEALAGAEA